MFYSSNFILFSIFINISSIITLHIFNGALHHDFLICPLKFLSAFSSLICLSISFLLSVETRWPVHYHPAGRVTSWHSSRYDLPVWPGLYPQRPGCPQHPGQQQPGVQGFRLRHVPSAWGRPWGCIHHQGELMCVCVCVCVSFQVICCVFCKTLVPVNTPTCLICEASIHQQLLPQSSLTLQVFIIQTEYIHMHTHTHTHLGM